MKFKPMLAVTFSCAVLSSAFAQNFPSKPVRIITYPTGTSGDLAARTIAEGMTHSLGQPVIVDNRGGGFIPGEAVAKSLPDGYAIGIFGGAFSTGTLLQKAPYDPVKDFAPITIAVIEPNILVVNPSVPAKSVKELIALAKAKPGQLNFGSSGPGSTTHLAMALFNSMAGVNIVHVPYKGSGDVMVALLGNQIQTTMDGSNLVPQIKAGKLRALAITSAQPSPLFPDLPTVAGSGLVGFESVGSQTMYAPARTPDEVVKRLNEEIVRALNRQEIKSKFLSVGLEVVGSTPEQLAAKLKNDLTKWAKVIKDAGINAN